jgi:hypothetical protein
VISTEEMKIEMAKQIRLENALKSAFQDQRTGEQMKTYKDGILEAAKLMLVRGVLSADGSVYRELIALAALEDQRSE